MFNPEDKTLYGLPSIPMPNGEKVNLFRALRTLVGLGILIYTVFGNAVISDSRWFSQLGVSILMIDLRMFAMLKK